MQSSATPSPTAISAPICGQYASSTAVQHLLAQGGPPPDAPGLQFVGKRPEKRRDVECRVAVQRYPQEACAFGGGQLGQFGWAGAGFATAFSAAIEAGQTTTQLASAARTRSVATPVITTVTNFVAGLLAAVGLGPSATNAPVAPVESPTLWAVLAWVRRQIQQTLFNGTPNTVDDHATATEETPSTSTCWPTTPTGNVTR
jgi:hypothetical protein